MVGMAIFKNDKMVGRISNDDALGYVFAMGNVTDSYIVVEDGASMAALHIRKMICKRKVLLRPDGGIQINLSLEGMIDLGELRGFSQSKALELVSQLQVLANQEVQDRILSAFEAAKELNADIFGFGTSVYRKYPKAWRDMEARWDELFQDINLSITADLKMRGTGQITQSLMEETQR